MFLMLLGELYVTVGGWMISRGLDYVRILKKCFYYRGVGRGSENGTEWEWVGGKMAWKVQQGYCSVEL